MGFFSSKKDTEPKENVRPVLSAESGFRTLRSRLQLYARSKLDSKERDSTTTMFSQPGSVAATLSPPVATPIANRQLQLKLSSSSPALRNPSKASSGTGANNGTTTNRHSMQQSSDANNAGSRSRALGTKSSSSSLTAPRKQSDNVTTTLAQRLNELAVANSEGLLNDDEYRLLRQDLFERFTSTNVVPTETPVVPVAPHQRSVRIATATTGKRPSIDSARISISTSSNFVVDKPPGAPSVNSRSSISGVASLFRRATGRQSSSRDDTSSVFSASSAAPSESAASRIKRLSRKTSNSSLTDRGDAMSISSRRTTNTTALGSPIEPATNAAPSVRSIRRLPMPPSSFPTRLPGVESRYAGMSADTGSPVDGKDNPESVQALRQEIQAVEAEARRLMDAFSGLELSTLTKHRRTSAMGPQDSVATLIPDHGARSGTDISDAASMRSATSAGTSASRRRQKPSGPVSMHGYSSRSDSGYGTSSLRVGSSTLDRKNSVSSMGSSRLGIGPSRSASEGTGGLMVPPVPPLPLGMSLGGSSTPSLARSTGHLPMSVLHEGEPVLTVDLDEEREFGQEMDDLRRRREEVARRYESRLEYLRAKLRGAELHEKLLSR
ncbi:hypothetical protein C8F01DRAFT_1246032 [Mycena amicta]|nr:hypothetical protein C8F01DRAFT_1246032 [Mycena amicta]